MTKIDILFRGPVRPDYQTAYNNIRMLVDCFHEFDITFYLFTWHSEETNKLLSFCNLFSSENVILQKEPTEEFILHTLAKMQVSPLIGWHINAFKQFWSMKTAMSNFVFKGDFVIQSRMDVSIRIDVKKNWLNQDEYITIYNPNNGDGYLSDQFGIARPEVMVKAWDYQNLNLLGKLMNSHTFPERVLENIIQINNVKYAISTLEQWDLNVNRYLDLVKPCMNVNLTDYMGYRELLKKYKVNL